MQDGTVLSVVTTVSLSRQAGENPSANIVLENVHLLASYYTI